jgi:hypothetical protein
VADLEESAEAALSPGDPIRVRPGRPHAGRAGHVYGFVDGRKPVAVILDEVEGGKYYAADELERRTLLTASDPEPPRRAFVQDDTGCTWWRTDADGIDNRSANWCTVEHGCASGSAHHDHETWTKVAGNYGPARIVAGTREDIAGLLEAHGLESLRGQMEQHGAAKVFAMLAAEAAQAPGINWEDR